MSKQNLKYASFGATVFAIAVIVMGVLALQKGTATSAQFGADKLMVITQGGAKHVFKVEIAETPEQLAQGLMYRDHLAADAGMLFIYPSVDATAMWMHNTQIPLDMLFIDNAGKVSYIAANNRPYDDRRVDSHGAATLEINGGKAAELGIQVGDRIENERLAKVRSF
jgi:uncharacterized membrane protein (UPF0127 family)